MDLDLGDGGDGSYNRGTGRHVDILASFAVGGFLRAVARDVACLTALVASLPSRI